MRIFRAGMLFACLAMCAGCFTREERITIRPDGSAAVVYVVEGDMAEFVAGDALPDGVGWNATSKTEVDKQGTETRTTTWTKDFADLNRYPRSFARPGDPHAGAVLQMETQLHIERGPMRTIYRFQRRYLGRRAGRFRQLQESIVPQELLRKAQEDEPTLTPDERERVFSSLAEYEALAMAGRAWAALGRAAEAGVIDVATFRGVLTELSQWLESRLTGEYLTRFFLMPGEEQDRERQALEAAFHEEIRQRVPSRDRQSVLFYLDDEERAFEVTADLSDEQFELTVDLPGTIVTANTLSIDDGEATWTFAGEDLTEGDLIMTATSVVEHDPAAR